LVGQKSNKKKNKNNPDIRIKDKKAVIRESSYCEENCIDKCKQYEDYVIRLALFKVCKGLICTK
jgi:hypothetical protein